MSETATRNVTSHLAAIGAGKNNTLIGASGAAHANASSTPYTAADAPTTGLILPKPHPTAAYHEYLDRHKPVLQSYWHNYVLDPTSPHAEQVIAATLRAERADLERLLEDVDVAAIAEDALQRSLERFEADCAVDLYLMVGV